MLEKVHPALIKRGTFFIESQIAGQSDPAEFVFVLGCGTVERSKSIILFSQPALLQEEVFLSALLS